MGYRASSPIFVGREDELERLRALAAPGGVDAPHTVLIGGDAGIGKSRLVAEFADGLEGTRVLTGGCLALIDGSAPYVPLVEVLRQLTRELGEDGLRRLLTGPRDLLRRLLPDSARAASTDTPLGRSLVAQLHEAVLSLLETLAEQRPVVLVLEDVHWASASTLDLLTFLAGNAPRGAALVVATFRTDELHRRHPLRPVLTELVRRSSVERLELRPLTSDQQRRQLTAILGGPPSEATVREVVARSEGNPFYAEELLAVEAVGHGGLPTNLRDILTQRVAALPPKAVEVLRIAAAAGRRVDHALLEQVADLEADALRDGLREAVAHGMLLTDGSHYRFRHALLQEAVHDDLLPGERIRLHRALTEAITADPALAADGAQGADAEIAHHADAAMLVDEAFVAMQRAAEQATRAYALQDALAHHERLLALWERCSPATRAAAPDRRTLLTRAASAAGSAGQQRRAVDLLRAAIGEASSSHDDEAQASLLAKLGTHLAYHGRPDEAVAALEEAVALAPAQSASMARVLARLTILAAVYGRHDEAVEWGRQAVALAAQHDAPLTTARASNGLGLALMMRGEVDEGEQHLMASIATARANDLVESAIRGYLNLSESVRDATPHHERALGLGLEGLAYAASHGWTGAITDALRLAVTEFLLLDGRPEEADAHLAQVRFHPDTGQLLGSHLVVGASLRLEQGRVQDAAALFTRTEDAWDRTHEPQYLPPLAAVRARIAMAEGRLDDAWELLDEVREAPIARRNHDPIRPLAARVAADLATTAPRSDEAMAAADRRFDLLRGDLDRMLEAEPDDSRWATQLRTAVAQVEAEHTRAQGISDPAAWLRAEEAVAAQGRVSELLYVRLRRAEALVASDRRDEAAELLQSVHGECHQRGLRALEAHCERLSRRARIPLEGVTGAGGDEPFGLTPREREVLTLVAAGLTNRAIGEQLFIAGKTASVHVSNILSKLDASTRGEAAAIARQHGLDDVA